MVVHPVHGTNMEAGITRMTIAELAGSFALELLRDSTKREGRAGAVFEVASNSWRLRWTVHTSDGQVLVAESATACVLGGVGNIVKATFNGSAPSPIIMIFVNNTRVGTYADPKIRVGGASLSSLLQSPSRVTRHTHDASIASRGGMERLPAAGQEVKVNSEADDLPPLVFGGSGSFVPDPASGHIFFNGSLEEIYLKNMSTEAREA